MRRYKWPKQDAQVLWQSRASSVRSSFTPQTRGALAGAGPKGGAARPGDRLAWHRERNVPARGPAPFPRRAHGRIHKKTFATPCPRVLTSKNRPHAAHREVSYENSKTGLLNTNQISQVTAETWVILQNSFIF